LYAHHAFYLLSFVGEIKALIFEDVGHFLAQRGMQYKRRMWHRKTQQTRKICNFIANFISTK
jgi:hypothetical protein